MFSGRDDVSRASLALSVTAAAVAVVVGITRIVLGVHLASNVVGASLGGAWVSALALVLPGPVADPALASSKLSTPAGDRAGAPSDAPPPVDAPPP